MKVDDLLILAGAHTLDTFDWGPRLVEVVNFVANDGQKLAVTMTGKEAHVVMRTLPSQKLLKMLPVDLDITTGVATGIEDRMAEPVMEAFPSPPPGSFGIPAVVDDVVAIDDSHGHDFSPPDATHKRWRMKSRHVLGLIMGGTIVLVALLLATVISITSVKSGVTPDSRGVVGVVQVMGDVVKSLFATTPPTAPVYPPSPYDTVQNPTTMNQPIGPAANNAPLETIPSDDEL